MSVTIETTRKVYLAKGAYIQVGPGVDGLGGIRICTVDKESKEWFGEFDFEMHDKEFVKSFIAVLTKAHEEMK